MVEVPSGTFQMGTPATEPERGQNELLHEVTLSKPFLLSRYEVTQAQWFAVMGSNPSEHVGDALPVENVNWHDAVLFCNRLSEAHGLTPAYEHQASGVYWDRLADGFRLPTEAEWEYACRAGTSTTYYGGSCLEDSTANCDCGNQPDGCEAGAARGQTIEVGALSANPWDLHDMLGNVREWCWDGSD